MLPQKPKPDSFAQRSFNLRGSEYEKLQAIARRNRCIWLGKPSIGNMLRKIAGGKLKVMK